MAMASVSPEKEEEDDEDKSRKEGDIGWCPSEEGESGR